MSEWFYCMKIDSDGYESVDVRGEFGDCALCQQYMSSDSSKTRWVLADEEYEELFALPAAFEPVTLFAVESNLGDELTSLLVRAYRDGWRRGEEYGHRNAKGEMERAVNLVFGPLANVIRGGAA